MLSESSSGKIGDRLGELQEWLQPIKNILAFSSDSSTVLELVSQLKQYNEEVLDLPKGMVTVLRLLKYISIPPERNDDGKFSICLALLSDPTVS